MQIATAASELNPKMTFKDTGLSAKVLAAVEAAGYTTPTPIQAQAIPHALAGRDVLGIAQTGTGKTAAFTLPMLSRLESGRARARMPRTLILEPTRELAAQVEESFVKYGAGSKLNVALLIGGVSFADQEAKIMRGADVLIATPGRLLDFADRGKILLTGIEILVIDEADRMLDMGFIPDIERICKLVPFTRQTLFFSATMPPEITRLTETFLHNPVRIEVARASTTASTITQGLVASPSGPMKREYLRRILRGAENLKNAIIFCNRKRDIAILHASLVKHGFAAGALHGDMDQRARMASLEAFKTGDVTLLVCSDVAARGLDIPDVSHVVNFDAPTHAEDYVHRIGRTGRAGRLGTAYTMVTHQDRKYIDDITKLIGRPIEWFGPDLSEIEDTGREERGERGRGGRDGGRGGREGGGREGGRGGRSSERRSRPHEEQPRELQASTEPAVEQPREVRAQEPVVAREPREPRPQRQPRPERSEQERPRQERPERNDQRQPRSAEPRRRPEGGQAPRPRYNDHDDGPPVIGLGDHVPSFLMRSVKLKPTPVSED